MLRNLSAPLVIGLAGTCLLLAANISSDYNHKVDFGRYHTYSWIKVQAENPLWNDRITAAVDNELMAKGWQKSPSGGDAGIAAYGSTHEQRSFQTWYDGFGGGWGWRRGWAGGPGMTTTTVERTPVGTLVVDIFDAQNKNLIWRGMSSDSLSANKPEKNEKKLEKDVADLFKKFPPPSKG